MRSQSKVLAEELPDFMDIRIKIHGNPDKTDIAAVKRYQTSNKSKLADDQNEKLSDLLKTLNVYYTPVNISTRFLNSQIIDEVNKFAGELVTC